jgi:glutathione S-transferase
MDVTLYIGNKNYSSWSLRPWLVLRWGGIAFEERLLRLGGDGYGKGRIAEIRAISPTGCVPALQVGETIVWESIAIAEWAAERAPSLWPADPLTRARARSVTAEIHAGFGAVRRDLSMNLRRRVAAQDWPADTRADLARIDALWRGCLEQSGGPWLFGARSIADAFYAPVVGRFRTYGVALAGDLERYAGTVWADPDMRAWDEAARIEPWAIPSTDALYSGGVSR